MTKAITTKAEVILTFDGKGQKIYDAPLSFALPASDLDAFEVEIVRQLLDPVPNADLQDLVKISVCYHRKGKVNGQPVDILWDDAEISAAYDHLIRFDAKYYFQPNQRDDYEQRIVDALGIASRTKDFD